MIDERTDETRPRPPRDGRRPTMYRGSKFMAAIDAFILCGVLSVALSLLPSVVGVSLLLLGVGTCLWHAHVAILGVSARVEDGALVVRNPARIHVVPLLSAKGFTMRGALTLCVTTTDGTNIEVAAASPIQRVSAAEVRERAQKLIAMVEGQESGRAGPVRTQVRGWSVIWLSVTSASMLIGFGGLIILAAM